MHKLKLYNHLIESNYDVSDKTAQRILSLPIHPYLDEKDQNFIISTILDFYNA